VPGCFNKGGFRFPKNSELRNQWIINVCREEPGHKKWVPKEDDRVCEAHFAPADIIHRRAINSDKVWRTLHTKAVPMKPTQVPPSKSDSQAK